MQATPPYKIFFIGDSAATIDFGNIINEEINKKAISLSNCLSQHPFDGIIEVIPAYSSVTIYINVPLLRKKISPDKKVYEWVTKELHKVMLQDFNEIQREK